MLRVIVSLFENHFVSSTYMLLKTFLSHVDDDWKDGYSYMALCCMVMKKKDEFLENLKIAVEKNPKEARSVLGNVFPEGMDPQDYYEYISNQLMTEE